MIHHKSVFSAVFLAALSSSVAGCSHSPHRQPASTNHYVGECMIMDQAGRVLEMIGSGGQCLFFPDGSVVTSGDHGLIFLGRGGQVVWKKKTVAHHQINFDLEQKNFLVLASSAHKYRGQLMRFDKLIVFSREGKELKSFDFFDHRGELQRLVPKSRRYNFRESDAAFVDIPKSVKLEFSHANSFYEIPDNAAAKLNPAFAKGNYIVNDLDRLVFVINREMNKILWAQNYGSVLHDVQLQESGWLLVYRNEQPEMENENKSQYSTIEELNPITGERRILFRANPPQDFLSYYSGGAQKLPNGNILFTKIMNGGSVVEVDKAGKVVMQFNHPIADAGEGKPGEFQQVKQVDLTEYFKNRNEL